MQLFCPAPLERRITAEERARADRWQWLLLLGGLESTVLFAAFAWQLYDAHAAWDSFNSSGLVPMHVLSLCVTLYRGPLVEERERRQQYQWLAYVWFRTALVLLDVLVLSRTGRTLALDPSAEAQGRTALAVVLTVFSVLRWVAVLRTVYRLLPEWADRTLATDIERNSLLASTAAYPAPGKSPAVLYTLA